jgi:thiol:disulfide interchange protein DsbD
MRTFIFLFAVCLFATSLFAQDNNEPTTWSYEIQKQGSGVYDLVFHVVLKKGFHVFSQKPGDDFLIPPSFKFDKNAKIALVGKILEKGNLKTEKMNGVDNPIRFYEDKVDFVQRIKAKFATTIKGEHEYQVCNDKMCFPPKKKNFEFVIKD